MARAAQQDVIPLTHDRHVASAEELLYHYTNATTALDYIVKNRTLRFGIYIGTNDPKESKAWEFDLGTNANRDLGKIQNVRGLKLAVAGTEAEDEVGLLLHG
ncbi:MAG: hypothetical protein A2W18_00160 [Candidatus Muproteobacteria bacterium RBG_16_60_9]|uniref:Uncharacterized protein n=1 Tax=Candidatus Muproteobacteria bacterium RBG_16_60_9 TaxID=1817755 RepID=A0A1F6V8L1_9PROT|nr:MAG: hypothetical protein A2W18_00160 [Candidatus Muproteobacteria bacterium RBG_16_60_9]